MTLEHCLHGGTLLLGRLNEWQPEATHLHAEHVQGGLGGDRPDSHEDGVDSVAEPIIDPPNDFVPTFAGPKNGDLDVIAAEVQFDGSNFFLHATLNGPVGTTPGGIYVWGFNRGGGTQGFPVIAPGVLFDRVVILRPDGTGKQLAFTVRGSSPYREVGALAWQPRP